jgi:hypothetical protein
MFSQCWPGYTKKKPIQDEIYINQRRLKMIQTDPTTLVCKHTPGPWKAADKELSELVNSTWAVYQEDGNGEKTIVASAWKTDDDKASIRGDTAEANAQLIACAPGLLEAAKKAMLFMEDCFEVQPPDDHEIKIYNALRGAIAGAGGFAQETHWWTGPCLCDNCQHRWQGVVEIHISCMSPEYGLECPNCHEMNGGPV